MTEKANSDEFGTLYLSVNKIRKDIYNLQQKLNSKIDNKLEPPTATKDELIRLEHSKADKMDVENLRLELQRIEGILGEFDEEFSESSDEYDEGSEGDDVISLGEAKLSNDKEEDEEGEDYFNANSGDLGVITEKAKKLAGKNLVQTDNFDSIKFGQEKEEKLKEEIAEKQTEEGKIVTESKTKILNKDVKEVLPKPEEIKSDVSPNNIDCAETNHSMGQTMNNFNNSNSRDGKLKNQTTIRSKRGGLSRMESKLSIATRKIRGKGRKGGNSMDVSELKLNMKKVLEDLRKSKLFEHESS